MSILLKFAYSQYGQGHIYDVLNKTKNDLLSRVKEHSSQEDLVSLSQFLTEVYHPTTGQSSNSAVAVYQRILLEESAKNIETLIQSTNLNQFLNPANSSYQHKTSALSTVQGHLTRLNQNLQTLDLAINTTQQQTTKAKMLTLKNQIQSLQLQAQQFIAENQSAATVKVFGNAILAGGIGAQAANLVRTMDAFNSVMSHGQNADVLRIGTGFEYSLARALSDYASRTIRQTLPESLTGQTRVSRGVYQGKALEGISCTVDGSMLSTLPDDIIKELNLKESSGFKAQDGVYTYTYNPGSEKQGKMDVMIAMQDAAPLRISAKSWTHGSRSLGETSVAAGLMRAVGPNIFKYYELSLLNPNEDQRGQGQGVNWLSNEAGHDLARLGILSDIIMGLNQGDAGRAEILVIDTGTQIVAKDISSLVESLATKKRLSGYSKESINNAAGTVYSRLQASQRRTDIYCGTVVSVLDKIKVAALLNQDLT